MVIQARGMKTIRIDLNNKQSVMVMFGSWPQGALPKDVNKNIIKTNKIFVAQQFWNMVDAGKNAASYLNTGAFK